MEPLLRQPTAQSESLVAGPSDVVAVSPAQLALREALATLPPIITIGIDVGQRQDPTAITVAEAIYPTPAPGVVDEPHYLIRQFGRLPLGTLYPQVVATIEGILAKLAERGVKTPTLLIDRTGVGAAVVDPLRLRLRASGSAARLIAVAFTFGDRFTMQRVGRDEEATLGKAFLVSRLQSLFQSERIALPYSAEAEAMQRELLDYQIRIKENANAEFGAFSVGAHDDLVTSLGLATLPVGDPNRLMRDMLIRVEMRKRALLAANTVPTPY